jgi:hypothetical protein
MDAPSLYRLVHVKSDIGHILFLRILYHIPYHGQKSDIISYPLSQLKKDRILYHISLPSKISQNSLFFKERKHFGKVTKGLFKILSIHIQGVPSHLGQ